MISPLAKIQNRPARIVPLANYEDRSNNLLCTFDHYFVKHLRPLSMSIDEGNSESGYFMLHQVSIYFILDVMLKGAI